jgi:hypothetical protein
MRQPCPYRINVNDSNARTASPIRGVPTGSDIFGPCRQSSGSSYLYVLPLYEPAYSTTAYDLQTRILQRQLEERCDIQVRRGRLGGQKRKIG